MSRLFSINRLRRHARRTNRPIQDHAADAGHQLEAMEHRVLLSATVTNPIDDLGVPTSSGPTTIDLTQHLEDDEIAGRVARFDTVLGDIYVETFDTVMPIATGNFFEYVNGGDYTDMFFHRSVNDFVVQGGGFTYPAGGTQPVDVVSRGNIVNEFQNWFDPNLGNLPAGTPINTRGTIANAKTSDPNSANSQFFFNTDDNSSSLDDPNNSGGFGVFGQVIMGSMSVVDKIAALPIIDAGVSPFNELPLRNYRGGQIQQDNLVIVNGAEELDVMTYEVVSNSNEALVTTSINADGELEMTYASGQTGAATITVRGTDITGKSVEEEFTVFVGADLTDSVGSFGGRDKMNMTINGVETTFKLNKGKAHLLDRGNGVYDILASGDADSKGVLKIKTKGDNVTVRDITVLEGIKKLDAKSTNIGQDGNITFGGPVKQIFLGNVADNHVMTIPDTGNAKDNVTIKADRITDLEINSGIEIKSITATDWQDTDADTDAINAPAVGKLTFKGNKKDGIAGNFHADMNLSGAANGPTLKAVKIADEADGTWFVNGDSGKWNFGSTAPTFAANVVGDLKGVTTKIGNLAGLLVAATFGQIKAKGLISGASILAGANLGADVATGGTGADADSYGVGKIKGVKSGLGMAGSFVFAGVDPVDNILGNGNDVLIDGGNGTDENEIKTVKLGGPIDGVSLFHAGKYGNVTVDKAKVDPNVSVNFV